MRNHWLLLGEEQLRYTGPDWLMILLSSVNEEVKAKILLLLWHAWHLRNDIVHATGTTSITGSALFLTSYGESLKVASQMPESGTEGKGKGTVVEGTGPKTLKVGQQRVYPGKICWAPPPQGWVKINTDAGFCLRTGVASTGIVARGEDGIVLLTAWRFLHHCGSPEEAEAFLEGIRLAVEWIRQPICVESDSFVRWGRKRKSMHHVQVLFRR
jgi:hypothetical protein